MEIRLSSRRVFHVHVAIIAALVCAHAMVYLGRLVTGTDSFYGLAPVFDLNVENNVPSLFSAVAMLAATGLLGATAEYEKRLSNPYAPHWRVLGALFVLLAVDESIALHERLNAPVRAALGTSGPLLFAWVIPYGLFTILVALSLIPFLRDLEHRTRWHFIAAGATYVTGALILELAGGAIWTSRGSGRAYFLETTAEETLEMLGIALFVRAIIAHNERRPSMTAPLVVMDAAPLS